ncbi:hypothetical protein Q7P37_002019 [Cladosporium fusiforme]
MKSTFFALAAMTAAGSASAQVAAYGQCGGMSYSGDTKCESGLTCEKQNDYYSQCVEGAASAPKAASTKAASTKGSKTSEAASTKASSKAAETSAVKSSSADSSSSAEPSSSGNSSAGTVKTSDASSGGVQYAGVNIAGLDFGCGTDGTCTNDNVEPGQTGIDQMKHFVDDDGLNTFRIPVGWQWLVDSVGGTLNAKQWDAFDLLIQGCLDAGAAMCIVDVHNYARWNGEIIGQGGPSNAEFASLWSQIATKYKGDSKVAFGVMNEPHDVEDIDAWAATVQEAVTAIRKAGATENKILLPGNDWTHASAFIDNGSGAALSKVVNLDDSTTNLIFDVHQYLDSDGSGTHTACTTNHVDAFNTLGDWLRENKRQAILTETGGGNEESCTTALCELFDAMNDYSDVYLGWTGWSAGMFDATYELSETPTNDGSGWTDVEIVSKCVAGKFGGK